MTPAIHLSPVSTTPAIKLLDEYELAVFPSPAGTSLTKLSLAGNNLFPARESLVSDIPAAGTGKPLTFFYSDHLPPFRPTYFVIGPYL
jgi:hypothetical protein